jgi:hypothetical protein
MSSPLDPNARDVFDPTQYSDLRSYVEAVQGRPLDYDNPHQQDILNAAIHAMYWDRGTQGLIDAVGSMPRIGDIQPTPYVTNNTANIDNLGYTTNVVNPKYTANTGALTQAQTPSTTSATTNATTGATTDSTVGTYNLTGGLPSTLGNTYSATGSFTPATGGLTSTQVGLPSATNVGNVLSGNILAGASWNSTNNTLIDDLTALTGLPTINTAVGGATSADTLNQLNTFMEAGGSFAPGSTVFLQTGGVDMLNGIDESTIKNNIDQIITTLENQGVKVVLTASPKADSLDDVILNNFETGPASFYSDIAAKHSNVALVDTMGQILQDKSLLRDHLHVNAAGEKIYNDSVIAAYERLFPQEKIAVDNKVASTGATGAAEVAKVIDSVTGTNVSATAADAAKLAETVSVQLQGKTFDLNASDVNKVKEQILAQGTTSKWSGEGFGSAEANAEAMAKNLVASGVNDINQVALIDKKVDAVVIPDGEGGFVDAQGNRVDASLVKENTDYGGETGNLTTTYTAPIGTEKVIGNKITGEQLISDYDRSTGSAWSGTFAGEGNTAFRTSFDASGKPIFYTTGASSNDLVTMIGDDPILGKVVTAVAATFGGPVAVAALQAAMGKSIEDIAKGALLTYVGGQVAGNIAGSTDLVSSIGADATNVLARGAGQFVSSGGKADIVQSLVGGAVDVGVNQITSLIPDFGNMPKGVQDFTKNVVATTIKNGGDLSMGDLVDAAITAGTAATKAANTGTIAKAITADKTINDAVTAELDKQLTIDASGARDLTAATKFADDQGYTKFTFDGKTYNVNNNNAENTVKQLEADALATNTAATTAANLKGGEFEGLDKAIQEADKRNTVTLRNDQADTVEEAVALAKTINPTATKVVVGDQVINVAASNDQMRNAILESKLSDAKTATDAKKIALEELGANTAFKWTDPSGKEQTLVTSSTAPLSKATGANATITNYVTDKLSKNLTSAEFNPADLTKNEMAKFVSTYANATDAQKATLLKGADSMTFKVIDTLLKQTAALNPTGAGDVAAPAGSPTLKAWDKGSIATAVDVAKAAGNVAAADIAGLGVRGAQFLGDLMGQDTNAYAAVQNLLVNDKDKSMSKLVGDEKVIAGGIASGVESAVAWTLGGPMAGVATIAGVVANNSWVEGAKAGLSVTDNAKRTASMTALEVAGEMLGIPGMKAIMKGIPVTGSVTQIVDTLKRAGGGLLSENATELLTTVAQFSVDKFASFGLNEGASLEDFQKALRETVIATTAAVGTSSGISTSTRAARGENTTQIADADRTAVSPDSLLTSGAKFGAKPGDTSNQGLNQITGEAIEFNKLDQSKQTTILDSLRSNIANISLAAALSIGSLASATEVESYVNNTVQTAASTGANVEKAISTSVSGSINSAINNKVSSETAINSAVSSAVTSAFNNNVDTSTAISTAVTSAVNTASTNAASTTAAVTTAVNSAVSTAISTAVTNNTMTAATVSNAVNTAVNSAVQAAVANNVSTASAVNTAVTAAVQAAVANNVSATNAVQAAVAAVTNLNVNVAAVTALATNVANEAVVKNDLITNLNNLIGGSVVTNPPVTPPVVNPPVVVPPVMPPVVVPPVVVPPVVTPPVVTPSVVKPPTTSTQKSSNFTPTAMAGAMFAGDLGRLPPQMLKAYMTQDKFVDPLAQLHALQENMNTEKMPALPQVNTQEPDMPDQGTWKYGTAPDDLDSLFGEKADEETLGFKEGGYVAPLQMASGGAMPLPLLVKSGGALGALPRGDGRLDFRHGAHVAGEGDGQSDDIKAMLADGEFVFPADVVSALGNGSTKAGSDKLYEMMHSIRERARSKKPKDLPPPALKSPLDYLKKVRSK